MSQEETWVNIPNCEPYQISNKGVVRGYGGKNMKPYLDPHGYYGYRLRKDGKYIKKYTHQMLAECFIPNPFNKNRVDHMNRDKTDNRLENLRWCTVSENNWNSDRHDREMYGIYWYETRQSYLVKLKINNKQRYIGWRKSLDEAKALRDVAKQQIQTELDRADELPT